MMFKRLTTRRVSKLRAIVEADRCDVRPGYRHDWEFSHIDEIWLKMNGDGPESYVYKCKKCEEYK